MFQPIKDCQFIALTLLDMEYSELDDKIKFLLTLSGRMTGEWTVEQKALNIHNILKNDLANSGVLNRRIAIWPVSGQINKSVYLCNCMDGCITIVNALKLSSDFIRIRVSRPDANSVMNEFEHKKDGVTRIVHSYWDSDKWVFFETGEILPFENPEYYKRRKKSDKINYEIINEYLEANGWLLNEESFWQSDIATYFIERHPNKKDE